MKAQFNKNYATDDEEELRYQLFALRSDDIEQHNEDYAAGLHSYDVKHNKYSDLVSN